MDDEKTKEEKEPKIGSRERIMELFSKMMSGETVNFKEAMDEYDVKIKAIQNDFKIIKSIVYRYFPSHEVYYDRNLNVHGIKNNGDIGFEEVLLILKMLISTRALTKDAFIEIADELFGFVSNDDKHKIKRMLAAQLNKYQPVQTVDDLVDRIGKFSEWINNKKIIEFKYGSSRPDSDENELHTGVPLYLYFDQSYFYVVIYSIEKKKNYVYRMDRFKQFKSKNKSYNTPFVNREDEGENANKTHLLKMGNDVHYKFQYWNYPQTALDKLPGSKIERRIDKDNSVIISGEGYAEGLLLWIMSQGDRIKVIEPQSLVEAVHKRLLGALDLYR